MVRRHQPTCVINPRSGWTGDFQCDEGTHAITGNILPIDWEKCSSIGMHWSYDPKEWVMPLEEIIKTMIDCFVRGGNVLLNVAPNPDGEIPLASRTAQTNRRVYEEKRRSHLRDDSGADGAGRSNLRNDP
ncbi:alpha-L-fucosidase [Paenibacillus sp. MDMC362]|uniref:alpha-L-fucosidase n=1 Tax=Paenibacillus sp. MDMC362 TaxID=2977365 RepID=UPI0015EB84F6|nr:alpha-L-fucosidase [Paenibacillus sp. MDMC362]